MPKRRKTSDSSEGVTGTCDAEYEGETQPVRTEPSPEQKAETKKKRKLDQLNKKIRKLTRTVQKERAVKRDTSEIKNKIKRTEVVQRLKLIKNTNKFADRLKKKTIRLEKGEDAVPKGETKTIEKMRVEDDDFIEDANDEEVLGAEKMDEFAAYFAN